MFCPHCGKEINSDTKFCPFCGKNVNEQSTVGSVGSVTIKNLTDNKNIVLKEQGGCFKVFEHQNDLTFSNIHFVHVI